MYVLTLNEKRKIIDKKELEDFRQAAFEGKKFGPIGVMRLIDYIEFLKKENARLRRSII